MDARKKKVLAVLTVATFILVWRIFAIVTKYMPSTAQVVPAAVDTESVNASLAATITTRNNHKEANRLIKAQEDAAKQPWGRDPFADLVAKDPAKISAPFEKKTSEDQPAPLRIAFTGVSKVGEQWRAIVSGRLVGVGDVVETDYKVSRITKRSITLQSRGWELHYELGTEAPHVERLSEGP
jgi:hypothetical protein